MLKKTNKTTKFTYIILAVILLAALFIRVYRVDKVLGFYFDQGRDALVIWDFLFGSHKPFLIGPTTGLAGIFRGPYYYYLVAPFYLLGHGNPVFPAVFLAILSVAAIYILFYLGKEIQDATTGLIAAIIASFSFYIVYASRWLSNPTPMLMLSMLLVFCLYKITKLKREQAQKYWVFISAIAGLSLFSFGSSGEFFYFPALFIFAIWQRRKLPTLKYLILSAFAFFLTFAPLLLFDLKHEHILLHNFFGTFGSDGGSFKKVTNYVFQERNRFYWDVFTNKLFDSRGKNELIVIFVSIISFLILLPKLIKNDGIKIVLLLLISPIIGLYFYQGNYGVLYDYYMTGYYLIFILLFAIVLGQIWRNFFGKIFVIYFLYLFYIGNVPLTWSRFSDGCTGSESICFVNQKAAIEWIYKDARDRNFNVDVYVPPVEPYAYRYLLTWMTNKNYVTDPIQVPTLYTLYEIDPPHPERLNAWLNRQKGIGKVEETINLGGITVERRVRIK